MLRHTIFLAFLISNVFCIAQNNGFVVDSKNNPIENVDVFLVDQNIILKTDSDGKFYTNNNLPNNTYINFFSSFILENPELCSKFKKHFSKLL